MRVWTLLSALWLASLAWGQTFQPEGWRLGFDPASPLSDNSSAAAAAGLEVEIWAGNRDGLFVIAEAGPADDVAALANVLGDVPNAIRSDFFFGEAPAVLWVARNADGRVAYRLRLEVERAYALTWWHEGSVGDGPQRVAAALGTVRLDGEPASRTFSNLDFWGVFISPSSTYQVDLPFAPVVTFGESGEDAIVQLDRFSVGVSWRSRPEGWPGLSELAAAQLAALRSDPRITDVVAGGALRMVGDREAYVMAIDYRLDERNLRAYVAILTENEGLWVLRADVDPQIDGSTQAAERVIRSLAISDSTLESESDPSSP